MKQRCVIVGKDVYSKWLDECEIVYESTTVPLESIPEIPDHDVLFTNIPIQSFSVVMAVDGEKRLTPFEGIMEIVRVKMPKKVLLENVAGLPLYNEGRTFKEICDVMEGAGYMVTQKKDSKTGRFYVRAESV